MNTTTARIPLVGLLAVQLVVGYEWTVSGLTKIVRGGFSTGLADELREKYEGAAGWYSSFLDSVVIPNGQAFGYAIELGEILIGVVLIGAALIWLFAWERVGASRAGNACPRSRLRHGDTRDRDRSRRAERVSRRARRRPEDSDPRTA